MTREEIVAELGRGECTVVFTKKDGTERTMRCTTNVAWIPMDLQPKGVVTEELNLDVIRAFDIENDGWRSFRLDSVKSFVPR